MKYYCGDNVWDNDVTLMIVTLQMILLTYCGNGGIIHCNDWWLVVANGNIGNDWPYIVNTMTNDIVWYCVIIDYYSTIYYYYYCVFVIMTLAVTLP